MASPDHSFLTEFVSDRWPALTPEQRLGTLQTLENAVAAEQHRSPRRVEFARSGPDGLLVPAALTLSDEPMAGYAAMEQVIMAGLDDDPTAILEARDDTERQRLAEDRQERFRLARVWMEHLRPTFVGDPQFAEYLDFQPPGTAHVVDRVDRLLVGTIAMLGQAKERLAELLPYYPMTYPRLAATQDQVAAAEARLGHPLDDLHARLLRLADGWPRMALSWHLLPTPALAAPGLWQDVHQHLEVFFDEVADAANPMMEQLHHAYPIATSDDTEDVFFVRHDGPVTDGGHQVIWFADDIVEVFSNVIDWMLAMKNYVEETVTSANDEAAGR